MQEIGSLLRQEQKNFCLGEARTRTQTMSRPSFFYDARQWPSYFVMLLGVTRYMVASFTILYFVPLFCFILPFSLGLVLILMGTLVHELDHRGQTNPTISHSAFVLSSFVLDAAGLIFLCSTGVKVIYAVLSEPTGGLNIYLAWIYWSGLLYCSLTALSLCCQLFLLRRMFVQYCGCTCCKEKEDDDGVYHLNIEDEASTNLVGDFETETSEDSKRRTSSSLNFSNDDVPKYSERHTYNFYDQITTVCLGLALVASIVLLIFGIADIFIIMQKDDGRSTESTSLDQCDPLNTQACLLPFPSDYNMIDDDSTFTGKRVLLNEKSFPKTRWGSVDPSPWSKADGFSTVAPILISFDKNVSTTSLIGWEHIERSLMNNATTLLLNADNGDLVPHFVDRDQYDLTFGVPSVEPDLLIIQPAQALEFNTTYIVAVRNLQVDDGDANAGMASPSPAFAALRDKDASKLRSLGVDEKRAQIYDDWLFPELEQKSTFRRDKTLQLAFYFHTTSREESLGRYEYIRDKTIKKYPVGPDTVTIDAVTENSCEVTDPNINVTMYKTISGHFLNDNYLVRPGPGPNSVFTESSLKLQGSKGIKNLPFLNGQAQIYFTIQIPCSLAMKRKTAKMILQYGHGLFGSRRESEDQYLKLMANHYDWIIVATDWQGMAKYDVLNALRVFTTRIGEFASIPDRTQQGWLDKVMMLRLIKPGGRLSGNSVFNMPSSSDTSKVTSASFIDDETKTGYYGNSQGSVIGGGYFASSVDLTHAALGVPGCPFSLLLSRSKDFGPYHAAFQIQIYNQRDLRIGISVLEQLWDVAESGGWLHVIRDNNWKKYPTKRVLMQAALGDAQVSTVAAEFMGRTYKTNTIKPQTRRVFGMLEKQAPFPDGSGFVEFKYDDVPLAPGTDVPPTDGKDTHECPRRERRGQDQIRDFFLLNEIVQHCHGICESKTCPSGDSKN